MKVHLLSLCTMRKDTDDHTSTYQMSSSEMINRRPRLEGLTFVFYRPYTRLLAGYVWHCVFVPRSVHYRLSQRERRFGAEQDWTSRAAAVAIVLKLYLFLSDVVV